MTQAGDFTEEDLQAADGFVPHGDVLSNEAYLISRGVRPMALLGHCPGDPLVMTRARTLLSAGRQGFDVLVFIFRETPDSAVFGYASHRWVISLLEWAVSPGVPPSRKHEILGLLLGYSPAAIARHQESDGLWEPGISGDGEDARGAA